MRGDRAKRAAAPPEPIAVAPVADSRMELDHQYSQARLHPRKLREAQEKLGDLATLDLLSAEEMLYARPQAGEIVTGASVRFAEVTAWAWGNGRSGSRVIHVGRDHVEAEGFFHDLETNTFTPISVRRSLRGAGGRRIGYDAIAGASSAAASIARRTAILTGIPHPFWRAPFARVEEMIRGDANTLPERLDRMLVRLARFGIDLPRVLFALGLGDVSEVTPDDMLTLHGRHSALASDDASAADLFPDPASLDAAESPVAAEGFSMLKLVSELSPMDLLSPEPAAPVLPQADGGQAEAPDSGLAGGGDASDTAASPTPPADPRTDLQAWGDELRILLDGLTDIDTLETLVEAAQPKLGELTTESIQDALALRQVIMKTRRRLEEKAKPPSTSDDRDETVPLFSEGAE